MKTLWFVRHAESLSHAGMPSTKRMAKKAADPENKREKSWISAFKSRSY